MALHNYPHVFVSITIIMLCFGPHYSIRAEFHIIPVSQSVCIMNDYEVIIIIKVLVSVHYLTLLSESGLHIPCLVSSQVHVFFL